MAHQTPRRITNAVEIYDECTLIWKHTFEVLQDMVRMNISNKDVYHDQFNNSN